MMDSWHKAWVAKRETLSALRIFNCIGGTDGHIAVTQARIEQACFNAAHYKCESDPGKIYRDNLKSEKTRLRHLASAARVLGLSAARNDRGFSWACLIAEQASGVRITRIEKVGPMPHNVVVEKYFLSLSAALEKKLPELHGGPFLRRFTRGNLIFNNAVSAGAPVTVETMLAFELAFYLRMHTAGHACDSDQTGQPMPSDGKPHYFLVAAFCKAALESKLDGKQTGDNVRALKNVELTYWPQGG